MTSVNHELNPLGKSSVYQDEYDPSLLFPIDRNESWKKLGADRYQVPFYGVDIWNGYEVSWLNEKGKPLVCMAEFRIPANSPYLVESKSFKLYLNSFNQTRFTHSDAVKERLEQDLSAAAGAAVEVRLHDLNATFPAAPDAICIDDLDIEVTQYELDASRLLLEGEAGDTPFEGWLCSHLLKSNCPVTGQPDWGSLYIYYKGQRLQEESLLAYIISMRQHQDFHEQCIERTYRDIMLACQQPEQLIVYGRYVRRGGLDINPFRCSHEGYEAPNFRLPRQ